MKWLAFAALLSMIGCRTFSGSELASSDDYAGTNFFHAVGDDASALALFPKKEKNGFITSTEQGWLRLLAGKPTPAPLLSVGRDLEERKTVRISREATAFFYKETEEGYFPAEHEAIMLHVITAMSLLAKHDADGAKVEIRKASFYVEDSFGGATRFDDPALRLWLASLWAGAGDWESARVDLRKAFALDDRLTVARYLAERTTPPAALALVLSGQGPEVEWTGEGHTVRFASQKPVPVDVTLPGRGVASPMMSTAPWYKRHQQRNQALKDVFADSRYMLEATTAAAGSAVTYSTGLVLGVAAGAMGVAAGAAIIYYGVPAATGDGVGGVILGGVAVAYTGIHAGGETIEAGGERAQGILSTGVGQAAYYRYVRFLPDQVRLVALDAPAAPVVRAGPKAAALKPFLATSGASTKLFVFNAAQPLPARVPQKPQRVIRHWPLTGDSTYAIDPTPRSFSEAKEACRSAPEVDQGRWHLPRATDVKSAVEQGLLKAGPENVVAPVAAKVHAVWIAGDGSECKIAHLDDSGTEVGVPCGGQFAALCVAGQ